MAWDKSKPVTNSALTSAEIRANWDALDAAIMALLQAGPAQSLVTIAAGGVAGKVNPGTNAHVLTMVGGVPTWQALPVDPGFSNPMTAAGDLIVGGASGTPGRLGKGTDSQVLTLAAGTPTWAAPTGGGASGPIMVLLDLDRARFPDGSANNAFPQPVERVSTGTPPSTGTPKLLEFVYQFDPAVIESLVWKGIVPIEYGASAAVTLVVKWSMLSATTGNIRILASFVAVADGATDVRAVSGSETLSADLAVPGTLGQQKETRLTLTAPTAAAGRKFLLSLSLLSGGTSSAAGDRVLEAAWLEFAR